MTIMRHLAAGFVSAIAVAALAGSALAAPPETPPGQEKAEEAAVPAAADTQAAPTAAQGTATAPGQAKKAEQAAPAQSAPGQEKKAAKAASSGTKSSGINSTSAGVKPANDTDKHTSCRTGGSMPSPTCTRNPHGSNPPDSSKRYGNGMTAAQIATGRGAPANTEIRGPGNSQPHKVCKKVTASGKEVWADVHSVKSWPTCVTPTGGVPRVTPTVTPPSITAAPTAPGVAIGAAAGVAAVTPAGGVAGAAQPEAGGVAGALDVLGDVAAGGALPFTGFPLWAVVLAGLAAIALGWALWRRGAPATRDVV